jgi:hypothetical protein
MPTVTWAAIWVTRPWLRRVWLLMTAGRCTSDIGKQPLFLRIYGLVLPVMECHSNSHDSISLPKVKVCAVKPLGCPSVGVGGVRPSYCLSKVNVS